MEIFYFLVLTAIPSIIVQYKYQIQYYMSGHNQEFQDSVNVRHFKYKLNGCPCFCIFVSGSFKVVIIFSGIKDLACTWWRQLKMSFMRRSNLVG